MKKKRCDQFKWMKNFVVNNIVNELKWGRQLTTAAAATATVTQPFHKFQVNLIDKAKYKWNEQQGPGHWRIDATHTHCNREPLRFLCGYILNFYQHQLMCSGIRTLDSITHVYILIWNTLLDYDRTKINGRTNANGAETLYDRSYGHLCV